MAVYTVEELKDQSMVVRISSWSDAKILGKQKLAESILIGLNLDTSVTGYQDAYDTATLMLFDMICENPAGFTKTMYGKVTKEFANDLMGSTFLGNLLKPYISGANGTLNPAVLERQDIGRR